jgi:nitrogen fixation/metabolism regulation signal transduction histidine kinase
MNTLKTSTDTRASPFAVALANSGIAELPAQLETVFTEYLARRMKQAYFANARSVRNALDRARLRRAPRLLNDADVAADDLTLTTITAAICWQAAFSRTQVRPSNPRSIEYVERPDF